MLEDLVAYRCPYIGEGEVSWEAVAGVRLVDTATGGPARLSTTVKACRTQEAVLFRFECEDDHIVAGYTNHDDPIYKEDVVEVFMDEAGEARRYIELELSPRNVVFDAMVTWTNSERDLNVGWDAVGMRTTVTRIAEGRYSYDFVLPLQLFTKRPEPGDTWRVNLYRIDEDPQGKRHYWAWSPTGAVNYHVPERFGRFVFE